MLYPLRFRPVYKNYLWGGRAFERLRTSGLSGGPLAESWEVSCHPSGISVIEGGMLDRLTLPEAIARIGAPLVGTDVLARHGTSFPLLAKFIDAALPLSVQVHPGDADALRLEGESFGKTEMWYVLEARRSATVVAGLVPGTTREALTRALEEGRPEPLLRTVEVRPGDVVDIPAGLVHAIGAGILLYELQTSCDITYRLHDYKRRDATGHLRPLHIPKALEVIDFDTRRDPVRRYLPPRRIADGTATGGAARRTLLSNDRFGIDELTLPIGATVRLETDGLAFRLLTAVEGSGWLRYADEAGKPGTMPLRLAETVLVPAALGAYSLEGPLKVLLAVPA